MFRYRASRLNNRFLGVIRMKGSPWLCFVSQSNFREVPEKRCEDYRGVCLWTALFREWEDFPCVFFLE